jgi:ribosome hibernation promoting factor
VKLIVTLRDPSIGEDAREYARDRIQHLEHYFDRITSAEVILSVAATRKKSLRAEFVVHANRGAILVAHAEDQEIRAAIDRAQSELKRELLRHKERLTDRHRARRESEMRKHRGR